VVVLPVVMVLRCVLDDMRSCVDVTDSSGTLTNDESYVTALRQHRSSDREHSRCYAAGMLQSSAAGDGLDVANKHSSASICSMCSQEPAKNATVAGSQSKTKSQLSDEEYHFMELQRSRGAIPKCRSDQRPQNHSGIMMALFSSSRFLL